MCKSRILISVAIYLALVSFNTVAEEPTLEQRLEQLAEQLESARKDAHVPGMSIAVVKDGEVIMARGFGLASIEQKTPADENTIYGIGSTTKAFTAALLGMLVDEGKLTWDDPVTDHLPYFDLQVRSDDENAECTLRDLLCHRHGFARMGILTIGNASREEVLRTAAGAEPWDDFREGFHYCNITYLAAGQAAGVAAGSTWDELMVERIFKPLKMTSSTLTVPAVQGDDRLALGYSWEPVLKQNQHQNMIDLSVIGPAGSVNSNVLDMTQWIRLLLAKGEFDGKRLIKADRLRESWEPQIEITNGLSYGLGWMLREHDGRQIVEHGGNVTGFTAEVALMPEENLGFVLLMNLGVSPMREPAIAIVFDALLDGWDEEVAEDSLPMEEVNLEEYAGFYLANFDSFRDERFEVQIDDGSLALHIPSQQLFALKSPNVEGKWSFAISDQINVSFQRNLDGLITGLTVHQGGFAFDVPREDVQVEPEVPLEELEKFVGDYRSEGSGRPCKIIIKHDRLFFDSGQELMPLHAPDADGHTSMRGRKDFGATFNFDAEGKVEAFVLHGSKDRLMTRVSDVSEAELPTVADVLALRETDKRIAAMNSAGGMKATGEIWIAQAGVRGSLTVFTEGSDRHASHLDFGKFGRVDSVANGDKAWSYNPLLGHKTLQGEELLQAILEHPGAIEGNWNDYFDSIEVIRNDTVGDRPVHVLRLKKEGIASRTYSVDAELGDVVQMKMRAIENSIRFPVMITYSDFKSISGIRMPHRVEVENPMSGRTVLTIDKVETGLELSKETFELEDLDAK